MSRADMHVQIKDAIEKEEERKDKMIKAIVDMEEKENQVDTGRKAFLARLRVKSKELENKLDIEYQKQKSGNKYNKKIKANRKNTNKKTSSRGISGDSMRNILRSPEFKKIWKESKEQDER